MKLRELKVMRNFRIVGHFRDARYMKTDDGIDPGNPPLCDNPTISCRNEFGGCVPLHPDTEVIPLRHIPEQWVDDTGGDDA